MKITKSKLKEMIKYSIFDLMEGDDKYVHIGYGRFKEKGKEKDKNAPFAKYMIGMSYFEQIIDVERDQGATRDSIREFSELIKLLNKLTSPTLIWIFLPLIFLAEFKIVEITLKSSCI